MTQQTEEQIPADTEVSEETKALVRTAAGQVLAGKLSLNDLLGVLVKPHSIPDRPTVPSVPAITDEQRDALRRLPEVYGKVVPTAPRRLTEPEFVALVEERDLIDQILGFAKKRKDESIRETLANHFDALYEHTRGEEDGALYDTKGHYAIKQEQPAPGTGKKAQRLVVGGKPTLTIADVERAHADGKIDRATYLKITKRSDTPRVLDPQAMAEAVQKDPALLFLLAEVAEPTTPTTQIKVVADK